MQPGKEKLCTDACDRVLQARPLAELCTGLAQNLKVPLPWGGDLRTCTRVGARGDRAGARRRIDCAAGASVPKGPDGWWRPTFADEFKGMPADATPVQRDCYTRQPSCIAMYASGSDACPPTRWGYESVKHLDKCTWSILHRNNTWAPDWAAFDARQVTVRPDLDDGVLIIGMRAMAPDGSYLPAHRKYNGAPAAGRGRAAPPPAGGGQSHARAPRRLWRRRSRRLGGSGAGERVVSVCRGWQR